MLYEVITNLDQLEAVGHQLGRWHAAASRFRLTKRPRLDPRQSLPLALAQLEDRITSYNVCYTKLLRCWLRSSHHLKKA